MKNTTYAIVWLLAAVILKGIVPNWLIGLLIMDSIAVLLIFNDKNKKGTSHRDAPDTTNCILS